MLDMGDTRNVDRISVGKHLGKWVPVRQKIKRIILGYAYGDRQ
jgi:hypothetical protein